MTTRSRTLQYLQRNTRHTFHDFFQLLNAVGDVRTAVQINPELPPLPDVNNLNLGQYHTAPHLKQPNSPLINYHYRTRPQQLLY
jgi:hypothetical protein